MLPDRKEIIAEYEFGKSSYKVYRFKSIYTEREDYSVFRDHECVQYDLDADSVIRYLCNALHNSAYITEALAKRNRVGE